MTLQEYYEKYWTVDGKPVPQLTDHQKWVLERMSKINKSMAQGMEAGMRIRAMIGKAPRYKPLNNSNNGE